MKIVPREYQEECVEALLAWFKKNREGNPLIGLPTGTGKSLVIALIIWRIFMMQPRAKVVVLTHRKQLIAQDLAALLKVWPEAHTGIFSAGLKKKDTHAPIIFAGIQSVASAFRRKGNVFGKVHIVFIDEAHCVSPDDETSYRLVLDALAAENPKVRVIGLTATAFRMKLGTLLDGGVFSDFAFDRTTRDQFNWFVHHGFLSPLIPKKTKTFIDTTGVSIVAGEFNQKELAAASNQEAITIGAVQEALELGGDRSCWLVFGTDVAHCNSIGEVLDAHGVTNVVVHSKRSEAENDEAIRAFCAGEVRALINANMLTTGFDCPQVDLIMILRATRSPGLWVQILGRGTRTADGKVDCLVLDYARNSGRLGPINDPVLPRKPGAGGSGVVPVKECEHCSTYNHISARYCIACEFEFEFETKIVREASEQELVAGLKPREKETFPVQSVTYRRHSKVGGRPTMRVTYQLGRTRVSEFICFEHDGYARKKAQSWWEKRSDSEAPKTVDDALLQTSGLREPMKITLLLGGKYPEIASQEF